jgi:hypothetical protein
MAYAHVQSSATVRFNGTSGSVSLPSNATAGNLLVLTVSRWNQPISTTTWTTGGSTNPVNAVDTTASAASEVVSIRYSPNCAAGAHTAQVTMSSGTDVTIAVSEYSGIVTSSPLDVTRQEIVTGDGVTSGATATLAQTDNLVLGAFTHNTSANEAFSSTDLTLRVNDGNNSTGMCLASGDKRVTATTGPTVNINNTGGSKSYRIAIAVFKEAATDPPQLAAPDADTSVGAWSDEGGATTDLYQSIDEAEGSISDADYVRSEVAPQTSVYEAGLAALNDPEVGTGHVLKVRALADPLVGGDTTLTYELRQGGSALSTPASWQDTLTGTAQTFERTLSEAMADAITDYSDLRLRFTAHQPDPGAPSLVGAGTAAFTATSGASFSPGLPTGWAADDIHILVTHSSNNTTLSSITGWTQIAALSGNNTTAQRNEVWWRRAVAGDAAPSITLSSNAVTIVRGGRIYGIRGCIASGSPFDTGTGAPTRSPNAASATVTFTDLTTTVANTFVLAVGVYEDDPNAVTTMTNWTEEANAVSGSTLGNDAMLLYEWRTLASAGAAGASSVVVSGGSFANSPNVGLVMALLPPVASASRARVTWAQLEVPYIEPPDTPVTRDVAGSQPAATGALTAQKQAFRAAAGAQPTATGTLVRRLGGLRAVAGAQLTATATLLRSRLTFRALAGAQGTPSATLTGQATVNRSVAGSQPTATGTLARRLLAVRSVAGAIGSGTGAVVRRLLAVRSLAGSQGAPSGVLVRRLGAIRSLAGSQLTATATLVRSKLSLRSLAGSQGAPSATMTGRISVSRSVAGSQPSGSGSLLSRLLAVRSVAGAITSGAGTLSRWQLRFRALAGAQPSGSGVVNARLLAQRALAGAQAAASGVLVRSQLRFRALTGAQGGPSGALQGRISVSRSVGGAQGPPSGALAKLLVRVRAISGAQQAPAGTVSRRLLALRALAGAIGSGVGALVRRIFVKQFPGGAQPAPTGTLSRMKVSFRSMGGVQGAPSGTLTVSVGGYAPPVDAPTGVDPTAGGTTGVTVESGGGTTGVTIESRHGSVDVEIG